MGLISTSKYICEGIKEFNLLTFTHLKYSSRTALNTANPRKDKIRINPFEPSKGINPSGHIYMYNCILPLKIQKSSENIPIRPISSPTFASKKLLAPPTVWYQYRGGVIGGLFPVTAPQYTYVRNWIIQLPEHVQWMGWRWRRTWPKLKRPSFRGA